MVCSSILTRLASFVLVASCFLSSAVVLSLVVSLIGFPWFGVPWVSRSFPSVECPLIVL